MFRPLNVPNERLSERIEAARRAHDGENRPNGPSEEALPWETFCMELAELSKERPGNDSYPKLKVELNIKHSLLLLHRLEHV